MTESKGLYICQSYAWVNKSHSYHFTPNKMTRCYHQLTITFLQMCDTLRIRTQRFGEFCQNWENKKYSVAHAMARAVQILRHYAHCRVNAETGTVHIQPINQIREFCYSYGPVIQMADNTIHWINSYPADNAIVSPNIYPLHCDLSGG